MAVELSLCGKFMTGHHREDIPPARAAHWLTKRLGVPAPPARHPVASHFTCPSCTWYFFFFVLAKCIFILHSSFSILMSAMNLGDSNLRYVNSKLCDRSLAQRELTKI